MKVSPSCGRCNAPRGIPSSLWLVSRCAACLWFTRRGGFDMRVASGSRVCMSAPLSLPETVASLCGLLLLVFRELVLCTHASHLRICVFLFRVAVRFLAVGGISSHRHTPCCCSPTRWRVTCYSHSSVSVKHALQPEQVLLRLCVCVCVCVCVVLHVSRGLCSLVVAHSLCTRGRCSPSMVSCVVGTD
jgi:hypothetical protein